MKQPLTIEAGKAAALFVDLQEEHRQDPRYRVEGFDTVLANARRLQAAARAGGIPVVHAAYIVDAGAGALRPFHPVMADGSSAFSEKGSPMSEFCPEIAPVGAEAVVAKAEASAFGPSPLKATLGGAEWLFVAGVWTEACIDATVKDAIRLGLRVLLVKDACGSGSLAMHQTGILNLANRLYGGAVVDTAAACRLMVGETVEAWRVQGAVPLRYTHHDAADLFDAL